MMPLPERGPGQRLIGVSIPVAQPFAGQLQSARRDFGDPLADVVPPHITLVPPTVVADDAMADILTHLGECAAQHGPFDLRLRGTGTFLPVSRVVFVQVAVGIPGCERLQHDVKAGPLAQRSKFRYHPHITVAHELGDDALERAFEELADYDASFEVQDFALYEYEGERWRTARLFALTGPRHGHAGNCR